MKRRELPGGYWWSDSPDRSVLFRCYAWAATVTDKSVELDSRHGKLGGPCGSRAQGKRFVERWVVAQTWPTYRRRRATEPRSPTPAELACDQVFRTLGKGSAPPAQPPPLDLPEGFEGEVGSNDVEFARVIELANR